MEKIYVKNAVGIKKTTEIEYNAAMVEKMKADIDYLSMMSDIDIPVEASNTEEENA